MQHEIMILHNPRNVPINLDTLNMTEEFLELKNHVRECKDEEMESLKV